MAHYELNFTVPSPGTHTKFIEFSPCGRFLAVGDEDSSSLHILDRRAGFHPTLSAITPAKPASLVWETPGSFYAGFCNGNFTRYRINPADEKLVECVTNRLFRGALPITAMALDVESKTLVLSVGPGVFVLRRICETNQFRFVANISSRFSFPTDPGRPVPPLPKTICFTTDNTLVVTFSRQHIASIALEFDGDSSTLSSLQTAEVDYSGLPILKAITSGNEQEVNRLTRCWIYDQFDFEGDECSSLLINGGVAMLSGTVLGAAIIRDSVTQREVQLLKHTEVLSQHIPKMAYHVSNDKYSIVTAGRGANAMIKVWTARRAPPSPRGRPRRGFLSRKRWIAIFLLAILVIAVRGEMGRIPNVREIFFFCSQIALMSVLLCIQLGYVILEAVEDAVLDLAEAL